MNTSTCSIDECTKPARARGWCTTHYKRWQVNGDLQLRKTGPKPKESPLCSMSSCDRQIHGRGLCIKHYMRNRRHGSPTIVLRKGWAFGEDNPTWNGDSITYGGMHRRVLRERGKPAMCEHCKQDAKTDSYQWALNWDSDEIVYSDVQGYPAAYSTNVMDYMSLCVSCHTKYDESQRLKRNRN